MRTFRQIYSAERTGTYHRMIDRLFRALALTLFLTAIPLGLVATTSVAGYAPTRASAMRPWSKLGVTRTGTSGSNITTSHQRGIGGFTSSETPLLDSNNPTITFDNLGLETTVTDQYADHGVVFTSNVFTTEDGSNPTSPVLSGEPKFQGEITAQFVTPGTTTPTTVNGFSLDVGYINNRSSVVVDYLDSQDDVVGSQYAQSYGINHLTITYRGIAGFTVYTVADEPAGFAVDNLVIDPTVSTPVTSIASLGDSYSSGEGRLDHKYDCGTDLHKGSYYQDTTMPLYDPIWIDGTDCDTRTFSSQAPADLYNRPVVTYENICHRNGQAYPNLIAQNLDAQQSIFVACSGAITDNVGATEGASQIAPAPQYPQSPVNVAGGNTQLTDLINFRQQRLGGREPDVITIGIGGNDANFAAVVGHCARPWVSDCKDGTPWAEETLSNINGNVFDRLVDTFTTLRGDFPGSTLLVFGYPTVVAPGATCGEKTAFMDSNETEFLGGTVLDALNSAVSDAAAQGGAYFIDISRVTQGHDVCSDDPWVNGIMPGIYGVEPESLHPNVAAHQAIARYFIDHYTDGRGNLLVANPEPSAPIRPAVGQSMHLATLKGTVQQSCGVGCLQPAACVQTCQIEVQGDGYSPGAQLHVVLHSTPVDLGEVTADDHGHIDTTVTIPAGTEPGLHWLAVDGNAADGTDQEGTLGVNVYATQPPPLRVHPIPAATLAAPSTPPGTSVAARRALSVAVHIIRHARTLTVKLTCPRDASSSCAIVLALQHTQQLKHRRKHTKTLLTRRITVPAGKGTTVVLSDPAIRTSRQQLRLVVTTMTTAGTTHRTFRVPR
jgi:hypothetical protein